MKPYKLLATAALLGFTLTGCDDFLEVTPEDKLIQDNYYTSREAIRDNTKALYSAKVWRDFHMNFHWKLDELVGDMYYTYDAEGQWYFGTYTDVNQYLNEGWKGIYNVVSQCNSVIMDMPGYVSGVAQEDVDAAIAEARAIRAYCYWYIAECWHDAPIITHNSNTYRTISSTRPAIRRPTSTASLSKTPTGLSSICQILTLTPIAPPRLRLAPSVHASS